MSDGGGGDVRQTLDAWRASGADRLDAMRFRAIDALARRAEGYGGAARRVLDERLAGLVAAYARRLDNRAAQEAGGATPHAAPVDERSDSGRPSSRDAPGRGALRELLDDLAGQPRPVQAAPTDGNGDPSAAAYPELPLLDFFREAWGRHGTRRQLRQSREHVPENAGPLNSSLVVHRMLSLMGDASPDYLHQFLSYVDALSWMEQAITGGGDKEPARTGAARKAGRGGGR